MMRALMAAEMMIMVVTGDKQFDSLLFKGVQATASNELEIYASDRRHPIKHHKKHHSKHDKTLDKEYIRPVELMKKVLAPNIAVPAVKLPCTYYYHTLTGEVSMVPPKAVHPVRI
jgi:hypothetical protein